MWSLWWKWAQRKLVVKDGIMTIPPSSQLSPVRYGTRLRHHQAKHLFFCRTIGFAMTTTSQWLSKTFSGSATSSDASPGVSPMTSKPHSSPWVIHISPTTYSSANLSYFWPYFSYFEPTCSFGRKPTVLLTHGLYFLAGAATLFAPNFGFLIFCRYCWHGDDDMQLGGSVPQASQVPQPPIGKSVGEPDYQKTQFHPSLPLQIHDYNVTNDQTEWQDEQYSSLPLFPFCLSSQRQAHLSTQVPRGLCASHSRPLAIHHRFQSRNILRWWSLLILRQISKNFTESTKFCQKSSNLKQSSLAIPDKIHLAWDREALANGNPLVIFQTDGW